MPVKPRLPDWLRRLQRVPTSECGIHWLSDEEVRSRHAEAAEGDEHLKLYGQIMMDHEGNLEEEAVALLRRAIPVGVAPDDGHFSAPSKALRMALDFPAEFWFDPSWPETLLCSLNRECPPHFWFPVGTSLESITSALEIYFPARPPEEPVVGAGAYAAMLRTPATDPGVPPGWTRQRMLLGVIEDLRDIENGLMWRSAFCREFDCLATADHSERLVPATNFRTVNSFSHISLKWHRWLEYATGEDSTGNPVVAEVTYRPAGHADLIRRYNQALDVGFPLDVPVDVVAALFGYPTKDLARLHSALRADDEPGNITYAMGLMVTTEGDDEVILSRLREFSTHREPNVRAKVARYASITLNPELIHQMIAAERVPDLKEYFQGLLTPA